MRKSKMKDCFLRRNFCELCQSREYEIIISRNFTDKSVWSFIEDYYKGRVPKCYFEAEKFEIAVCKRCGFIWQVNILNEFLMKILYDEWICANHSLQKKQCAGLNLYTGYALEMETIITYIGKPPFEINALDFGMGWGYWCLMAKAWGLNVFGFDVSNKRIEFARKNGIEIIEEPEDLRHRKFHFINCHHVLEHIPEPSRCIWMLANCIHEGGLIRVAVPDGSGMEAWAKDPGWHAIKDALHPLEHINCFTNRTLLNLVKSVGLNRVLLNDIKKIDEGQKNKNFIKSIIKKLLYRDSKRNLIWNIESTDLMFVKP